VKDIPFCVRLLNLKLIRRKYTKDLDLIFVLNLNFKVAASCSKIKKDEKQLFWKTKG